MKTIRIIFYQGMNVSSLKSKYFENAEEELEKVGDNSDEMKEIIKHFYELNEKLKDRMYIEKADEVFKCIPMKMEEFYEKFDKECMNIPIFKYYDPFQTFQRITCATNEDVVAIKEKMAKRAELYTKEIEPEMQNIKQLRQIIEEDIKGRTNSIKTVLLREFSDQLGEILNKYKTPFLGIKKEENNEV